MDTFRFENISNVAVLGAGHGIGLSLVEQLRSRYPTIRIFASYRREECAEGLFRLEKNGAANLRICRVDPVEEACLAAFYDFISTGTDRIDLVINCVGVLQDSICAPEKSLAQISMEKLVYSFCVNAAVTPLLAKALLPLLRNSEYSMFVSLSAKVGSIEDNLLGGWYGYRASKAALNMFIKCMAIEFTNRSIPCIALSLHPGTTRTALSNSFLGRSKLEIHTPEETASNILSVLGNRCMNDSGKFLNWDGLEIPW